MNNPISDCLFAKAGRYIPGGVNSPVRAYLNVDLNPPFIRSAQGCRITDADGHEYLDYVCSWGPLILGHAHPNVLSAILETVRDGTSFGAPTEREIILAEMICQALPAVEMVRMVNSGTEAVMSALRLARAFTGRTKIVKFAGCYHGHSDALLVKAGSGLLTAGRPDSAGVPGEFVAGTLTAPYNDGDYVEKLFRQSGSELAAALVEPVAGNMGVVAPQPEFLRLLRRLTEQYGAVLIFDEVITGFRISYHGAQGYYGITPDLTTLGKIIGGGMPVGAYGGKKEIMQMVAPLGPVYQAGTLSGNPVAMAAGIATLRQLQANPGIYEALAGKARFLEEAFLKAAAQYGIPLTVNRAGSLLSAFFTGESVVDYRTALHADTQRFARYFKSMLNQGIYLPPSQFEALFLSTAHTQADLERTAAAIDASFRELTAIKE
ncbi:MAG: glutamate-1-semialdehyde 2,1-aminomutase [Bacillota bacterium]|jgi:glutamate-1-semialdehyde 2,1-aminomutase